MAHEIITRRCGHSDRINLIGSSRERERRRAYEQARQCLACWRASQQEQAETAAAAEGLPALTGTPQQIDWARTLRHKRLAEIDALLVEAEQLAAQAAASGELTEDQLASNERLLELARRARRGIAAQAEARYWIDRRDLTARQHLNRVIKAIEESEHAREQR